MKLKSFYDKYKVVIDENAADNVKLIYEMYLQGHSQGEITKYLTKMKINTPKKIWCRMSWKGGLYQCT